MGFTFLRLYVLDILFFINFDRSPSYFILIIMKKMEMMQYESPQVEIIEVEVERGFAQSPGNDGNIENPVQGNEGEW